MNTRGSQQNAEATALLKTEVEALRYLAPTVDMTAYGGSPFCIDPQLSDQTTLKNNVKTTATDCDFDATGTNPAGADKRYHVEITYDSEGALAYQLKATWDDVAGGGQDTVTLMYRTYTP